MSDPLDRLSKFGSSFEGGTMPKSPADVRARGDQIRRRRQGLLAGGAAAVVAAVAIPVLVTSGGDGAKKIDPAPRPDQTTIPLSTADLMVDSDTEYHQTGGWATTGTIPEDGHGVFNVCQRESLSGLGATTVFQRDFHWVDEGLETFDGDPRDYAPGNTLTEAIAEFDSGDQARAAYDEFTEWLADCTPPESDRYDAGEPQDVDPGVEGEARTVLSTYGPVPRSIDDSGDFSYFLETGLVVTGERIAVITQTIVGQDYNWSAADPSPVTRMIPNAAERLQPDVPVDTDLTDAQLPTGEDAVFFSGSDWVEESTSEGEGDRVNPCLDRAPSAYGAEETWRRDFELEPVLGPDDLLVATVSEFPTPRIARAAYQAVQADVEDCVQSIEGAEAGTFADEGVFTANLDAVDGQGTVLTATYVPEGAEGYRAFLDTGLAVVGSRLLILTQQFGGQDYLTEPTTLTTLESAAPRLVDGASTPTPAENAEMGVIPDGFPLEAGWPDSSEAEGEGLIGPSRDLEPLVLETPCGDPVTDLDHIDRLRATWDSVEDVRNRQLTVYADGDVAGAAVEELIAPYQGCPTGPEIENGVRTETEVLPVEAGDEGWAILERDGDAPFGETTVVVRVATAVLVINHGGHAGRPEDDSDAEVAAQLDEAAEVIAAMPQIQENMDDGAGDPDASEGPDLNAPAGTTEVPEDFPLDVHLDEGVEQATQVNGPDRFENGVFKTDICGEDMAVLSRLTGNRLGYGEVYEGEGYHGRAVRAYPTVQAAVDELERLESQLAACEQDVPYESTATRLWHPYESATGWNDVTFGFTYQGQAAGGLYTVVRVGNALLSLSTSGEYTERSLRSVIPRHAALVEAIAPEMCIFRADGC